MFGTRPIAGYFVGIGQGVGLFEVCLPVRAMRSGSVGRLGSVCGFVLLERRGRRGGALVRRAWNVVEAFVARWMSC
jgi:hypothetical protein